MHDRPSVDELIGAVRGYLEQELIPSLADARLRFQTLVAANVLTICERQLRTEEEHLAEEWAQLGTILQEQDSLPTTLSALREAVRERNRLLCERIRTGQFDDPSGLQALREQLRQAVERKLQVANPKYLASVRDPGTHR